MVCKGGKEKEKKRWREKESHVHSCEEEKQRERADSKERQKMPIFVSKSERKNVSHINHYRLKPRNHKSKSTTIVVLRRSGTRR
jgi:hypothetical protein